MDPRSTVPNLVNPNASSDDGTTAGPAGIVDGDRATTWGISLRELEMYRRKSTVEGPRAPLRVADARLRRDGSHVIVELGGASIARLDVVDAQGRVLRSEMVGSRRTLSLEALRSGVLTLGLAGFDGSIPSRRMVLP